MASKRVGIIQSNYIPWKGYFDFINSVDEFVLLDDVQYTRRDWRNRNKLQGPKGLVWLTIPVEVKGKYLQRIDETKIADNTWNQKHWNTIYSLYSKSPFFKEYEDFFKELYAKSNDVWLSKINYNFISAINSLLGIKTPIRWSSDFTASNDKNLRLVEICKSLNATEYLSGPSAKSYINEDLFLREKINVKWMDYHGYREYPQTHLPFEHGVSILDLFFNAGPHVKAYMKSFSGDEL